MTEIPGAILDQEALEERARNLGERNGIKRLFVTLEPPGSPRRARIEVEFHNDRHLVELEGHPSRLRIEGPAGRRVPVVRGIVRAQAADGSVRPSRLTLDVSPIGDYSTYTLTVHGVDDLFDPLFRRASFKFRPGCFNLNCAPSAAAAPAAVAAPEIPYLARDYETFRHVMMNAMRERVPGWEPTSEADLDQVLIDLIAADADFLADFQDRVMSEAYLATARRRVSVTRHARLLDYHVHHGNQATTWLAVQVSAAVELAQDFGVWTGDDWTDREAVVFAALPRLVPVIKDGKREVEETTWPLHPELNVLIPYTWGGVVQALDAGATSADLTTTDLMTEAGAMALLKLLSDPEGSHILIQEELNPESGSAAGRDIRRRQVVRLVPGAEGAEAVEDPAANRWLVRVHWRTQDALRLPYCLPAGAENKPVDQAITRFYGNLIRVSHGRPQETVFRAADVEISPADDQSEFVGSDESQYETTHWGAICQLTKSPLAYLDAGWGEGAAGAPSGRWEGATAPTSTLRVSVMGSTDAWEEKADLIESDGSDEHFVVETDELGRSLVRFGDGTNGAPLPENAEVTCRYRVGQGTAGNVGADTLTGFDPTAYPEVVEVWNPLDVTNGRDPQSLDEVIRIAPEAYRQRQRRAVTLEDYAGLAEEERDGVAHAKAHYAWTGSWRTVRVVIDPLGGTELKKDLRAKLEQRLDALRLTGEDVEIVAASYVPLDIRVVVCARAEYWPEDLRSLLESEFSDGQSEGGGVGFFHPDSWTFGQPLHASQIFGRALALEGVERVVSLSMRRWNPGSGGGLRIVTLRPGDLPESLSERIDIGPFEILQVANDPDHLDKGRIRFEIQGGRR